MRFRDEQCPFDSIPRRVPVYFRQHLNRFHFRRNLTYLTVTTKIKIDEKWSFANFSFVSSLVVILYIVNISIVEFYFEPHFKFPRSFENFLKITYWYLHFVNIRIRVSFSLILQFHFKFRITRWPRLCKIRFITELLTVTQENLLALVEWLVSAEQCYFHRASTAINYNFAWTLNFSRTFRFRSSIQLLLNLLYILRSS